MAYQFNATNYLTTASSPVSDATLTLAFWFYPRANGAQVPLYIGNSTDNSRYQMQIQNGGAGLHDLGITAVNSSATIYATARSGVAVTLNKWAHGCGVFSGLSSRTVYQDGGNAVTDSTTIAGTMSAPNRLAVASRFNGSYGLNFNGAVCEVGVWNVALAADEIASLARGVACRLVRPQSLVFYAPLVRDLVDLRGGLTITNNNSATVFDHPGVYA